MVFALVEVAGEFAEEGELISVAPATPTLGEVEADFDLLEQRQFAIDVARGAREGFATLDDAEYDFLCERHALSFR